MRNQFVNGRVSDWTLECSANYLIVISDGQWMQPGKLIVVLDKWLRDLAMVKVTLGR